MCSIGDIYEHLTPLAAQPQWRDVEGVLLDMAPDRIPAEVAAAVMSSA